MKINANEIKVGMLIEYKDDLWEILKTQHVKPGKGGAFCQVEMKSINKNTKLNERFRSNDTIEKASIENIEFNYLYDDEINYYFINQKNFEGDILNTVFKEYRDGELKFISFNAKKARGLLAKFIINNKIKSINDLKDFNLENYKFDSSLSDDLTFVITR